MPASLGLDTPDEHELLDLGFAVATCGAALVGSVSLTLSLLARARSSRLASIGIAAALGYLASLGIVMLDIIIEWIAR